MDIPGTGVVSKMEIQKSVTATTWTSSGMVIFVANFGAYEN